MTAVLTAALLAITLLASSATAQEQCAQPISDGDEPTIADCIHIARSSIGSDSCRECVCDADGSGNVELTDALRCLRVVIGFDVELECPPCIETTTTLPGCAPCREALVGLAEPEDLCEVDAQMYDDLKQCLCGCCDFWCRLIEGDVSEGPECRAVDALRCLKDDCADALSACAER